MDLSLRMRLCGCGRLFSVTAGTLFCGDGLDDKAVFCAGVEGDFGSCGGFAHESLDRRGTECVRGRQNDVLCNIAAAAEDLARIGEARALKEK